MSHLFAAADILLPNETVDLTKWAALACDQFTSEPAYWQDAEALVQNAPSTLSMVLPELYLDGADTPARIANIHKAMQDNLQNTLTRTVHGFVYVERKTPCGVRCGLVGTVDLEAYSYEKGAAPLVRPSENTVVERIPPRLAVRTDAALETPHILMLLDADACTIIEPLALRKQTFVPLYDFDLMLDGGHISGYGITDAKLIAELEARIDALADPDYFAQKYPGANRDKPMALAVGDGNHSLATAKAHWEEIKQTLSPAQRENHPARRCLVELVNIHCPAIVIEPIHRVLLGTDESTLLLAACDYLEGVGATLCPPEQSEQVFHVLTQHSDSVAGVKNAPAPIAVGTLEGFLSQYLAQNPCVKVDYIHDEASVRALVEKGYLGIILPPFAKSDVFRGVVMGGVLPKKTFSMGAAREKRYYLECRKIR